jgi:hypothetical protein
VDPVHQAKLREESLHLLLVKAVRDVPQVHHGTGGKAARGAALASFLLPDLLGDAGGRLIINHHVKGLRHSHGRRYSAGCFNQRSPGSR